MFNPEPLPPTDEELDEETRAMKARSDLLKIEAKEIKVRNFPFKISVMVCESSLDLIEELEDISPALEAKMGDLLSSKIFRSQRLGSNFFISQLEATTTDAESQCHDDATNGMPLEN